MLSLQNILINVPITLIALTVHECAHGWVSAKQGDPTPRYEGRLTLNPMAHLDPVGTILMILTGFGWAKPVGVNPMYYRDRKKGMALTAAAGPVSNLILAFVGILLEVIIALVSGQWGGGGGIASQVIYILGIFVIRNLCFAVFNLIPLPPLDGSRILGLIVPDRIYYNLMQYERYAMIVIMVLSLTGAFDAIIGKGVMFLYNSMAQGIISVIGLFV